MVPFCQRQAELELKTVTLSCREGREQMWEKDKDWQEPEKEIQDRVGERTRERQTEREGGRIDQSSSHKANYWPVVLTRLLRKTTSKLFHLWKHTFTHTCPWPPSFSFLDEVANNSNVKRYWHRRKKRTQKTQQGLFSFQWLDLVSDCHPHTRKQK